MTRTASTNLLPLSPKAMLASEAHSSGAAALTCPKPLSAAIFAAHAAWGRAPHNRRDGLSAIEGADDAKLATQ